MHMITLSGTPGLVRGAMGRYATASATFNSDKSLAGKTLHFNPGLFTSASEPPTDASAYTISYPSIAGTYAMSFIAPDVWKNGRADIEVLDNFRFRITLYFFFTSQIGYVSGLTPPGLPFLSGTVYSSGSGTLAMYCRVGVESAVALVPVLARSFESADTVTIDYTSGIKITAETTRAAESVAFMGIYANSDFRNKAYAQIAATPGRITGLDADAFIQGSPFVRSGGVSKSTFSLDPEWMTDGTEYTAYVVYRVGEVWYSAKSETVTQGGGKPAIFGDITYLVRDNVANYATGCMSDVPPCKDFSVSANMDATTYNAALAAAGVSGSMSSRFQFVRATLQTSLTGSQGGQNLQVVVTETASGITALVESFIPSAGVQYIVFGFQFFFDTGADVILVPVQFSTVASTELAAPEELCFEEENNLTIPLPVDVGTAYVSQRDGNGAYVGATGFSFSGSNFVIDPTNIPVGVARCYKICSEAVTSVEQDCVCDCDCISLAINVTLTDAAGGYSYQADLGFPVSGADVSAFEIQTTGGSAQNQAGVTTVFGTGAGDNSAGITTVYISGQIALANGCRYDIPVQTVQLRSGNELTEYNRSLQLCIANCDCDEVPDPEPECDNTISFESDCTDGVLTFTANADLNSTASTDVTDCAVDGGAYAACAASYTEGETVTIRRRVSFSDGCPDIEASLTASCEITNNCENAAELTVDKTDALLTLMLTGMYASTPATEEIFYSLNGGLAYQTYTEPVTLEGDENIRVYSVTTFTDGCPDIVTPTQSAGGLTVDNTEPLVEYCNNAGEITGFAALIGSGDNLETIYFDTDMVQTTTVPEGSPCETFTPCATCP